MLRYAITVRNLLSGPTPDDEQERQAEVIRFATHCAEAGVNFLQIREKDLSAKSLTQLARQIIEAIRATGSDTKILINSRADIAIATATDGVHLTASPEELTPAQIRQLYAAVSLPTPIITISCHTLAEVVRATAQQVDTILFGPVFEKSVAGEIVAPGIGLATLAQACAAAGPTPVLALGGVTTENTPACLRVGAAGIAAIRLFQSRPHSRK